MPDIIKKLYFKYREWKNYKGYLKSMKHNCSYCYLNQNSKYPKPIIVNCGTGYLCHYKFSLNAFIKYHISKWW